MTPPSSELFIAVPATLPADVALHARPAGLLVKEAARLGCPVTIVANGKRADAKSILHLSGTELDYKDELMQSAFVFNNPNIKGTCGCGTSFHT